MVRLSPQRRRLTMPVGRSYSKGCSPGAGSGCTSWPSPAGGGGVSHDLASAGDQAIESALAEPRLRRLAVLLDGLAAELRDSSPVSTMERLPVRRWADLWMRATLLAEPGWPTYGDSTRGGE